MPRSESPIVAAAADVRLPPADAWATEVLQCCAHVHYTPQKDLLNVLAPVPRTLTESHIKRSGAAAAGTAAAVAKNAAGGLVGLTPFVVDVDAEEDVGISPCYATPDSPLSSGVGGDSGSYQPYLPRVVRTTPTTESKAVRAALSASLLRKAYRLQIPCLCAHTTKGERLLNCAASPKCMSGLRTLAGDAVTREDCLTVVMGEGPRVVAITATKAVDARSAVKESFSGAKEARVSTGAKHAAGRLSATVTEEKDAVTAAAATDATPMTAARTVVHDPTFPCLWRGVRNLTNTCYFSSVLQMVFSVARLRRVILDDSAAEKLSCGAAARTQLEESGLKELFALMAFSRDGAGADPKSFASYLSLDPKVQQDAQEFLTLLLDWLRCHCGPAVQAAVTSTFSGTLLYDRRCGACGRSAKRAESFLYLSLPVRSTLEDSLSEFSKAEEVDGFMCEGCGKTTVATSRQYMRTLPDVLVIHWNRFEFDLQTLQRHKVTTATSFPLQLDMACYMRQWHEHKRSSGMHTAAAAATVGTTTTTSSSAKVEVKENHCYELRGIVNHHGDTAVSGHYTYHGKVSMSPVTGVGAAGGTSTATWLNFNDAEVTPLNRYQGQRGVSADAYLLVYHRVVLSQPTTPAAAASAPSTHTSNNTVSATTTPVASHKAETHMPPPAGNAASALTTSVAMVSTSAAPTPDELPLYLRQYVDQVNQRCLDERHAWLDQRAAVAALFDLWASTAQAVFDTPTSAWASTTMSSSSLATAAAPTLYALPTMWLQQLGRFFLPAYVDVSALGGRAESQLKRNRMDAAAEGTTTGATAVGGGVKGSTNPNSSNSLNDKGFSGATSDDNDGENRNEADGAPADGVVVPAVGPRGHGYIRTLEDVYQFVRQHSLLQALPSLHCPHGYLAPWGAYKLVSATAFAKLAHFLSVCNAPMKAVVGQKDIDSSASNDIGLDAQRSCAFVDSNLCPLCVAAMAAAVQRLAVADAEDEQAELCLTQAWHDAEKEKEAEESSVVSGIGGSTDTAHKDNSTKHNTGAHDSNNNDAVGRGSDREVLVSEIVVEGWASYYVSQLAWSRVQQTEGYTAVMMMKEARLNPPRTPSSATRTSRTAVVSTSNDTSRGGATSPTSPTGGTTMTTLSPTLISAEDGVGIGLLNVGKNDLNLSSQLLCPHGALRPGQHVLAIPAKLRRYWVRRFTEILTMAHRAGQLHTADPLWRVKEDDVEFFLLPYIPASTMSTTCLECMRSSVQTLTSHHHRRLRKMEERRKFPSLWLAGAMTSPSGIAQLLLSTGAKNEEQLLAAQHPNRLFFKHNVEREYREYTKKWTEAQQARLSHQEAEVHRLQATVAKKKEHDAAWNARVMSRREGRNTGRGTGNNSNGSSSPTGTSQVEAIGNASTPDPETLEGRLYYAEATLAKLRAQPVPDFDVAYGCVPTWWVARWYAAMQDDNPQTKRAASVASSIDTADAVNGAVTTDKNEEQEGTPTGHGRTSSAGVLPPITYDVFKCEHGGCLLDVPWLNPSDGFWQGVRGKRAEMVWNGVQAERASTSTYAVAAPESGPGRTEYRSQCWLPPLVILPMEEYLALLVQYGAPDILEKTQGNDKTVNGATAVGKPATPARVTDVDAEDFNPPSTTNETSNADDTTPSTAQSVLSPAPGAVIRIITHNGVRQLQPAPCADCCARLLANFEVNCESFVNGSLKLNFHIRKSRKNFYDASSVLTSSAVQQSKANEVLLAASAAAPALISVNHAGAPITILDNEDGEASQHIAISSPFSGAPVEADRAAKDNAYNSHSNNASIPDGIHFYTTLAQLRTYISAHLREKHGYLVQPEELQIMRGKNKPLRLRSPPPPTTRQAQQQGQHESTNVLLENATLHDLGIRDGDTLTVQSIDTIAQVCTTAPGADEEWEAIPPELLQGGGNGGRSSNGAAAGREHTAAFRETRLQGSHTVGSDGRSGGVSSAVDTAAASGVVTGTALDSSAANEEQGVACAVCTFLNAPGMVVCEMCEAPLQVR